MSGSARLPAPGPWRPLLVRVALSAALAGGMALLVQTAATDSYDLNLLATPILAVWAVLAVSPAPRLVRLLWGVAAVVAAGLSVVTGQADTLPASVLLAGVAMAGAVLVTPRADDVRPHRSSSVR